VKLRPEQPVERPTHHPHLHMIVPGGGISLDSTRWMHCRPGFLLPALVLTRLFQRLFLSRLADAHAAGRLAFFGKLEGLCRQEAFAAHLAPLRRKELVRLRKAPFAGPEAVLAYLAATRPRLYLEQSPARPRRARRDLPYKDFHLIAPHRQLGNLASAVVSLSPRRSQRQCDTGDHCQNHPSTAAATTNSRRR
jgi:hypothetical protein